MSRKGYAEEYLAKKILIERFGNPSVIKLAISQQGSDYLVFVKGKLIRAIEIKACHSKKYYPSKREIEQFKRIISFCKEHGCSGELWVKYPHKGFCVYELSNYLYELEGI